jgi:hypothetical protein
MWFRDGRELFYNAGDAVIVAVYLRAKQRVA